MQQANTVQHPSAVDSYIRHGWSLVPIPPGTKGPRAQGWNKRESALTSAADLPPGCGIGLAHAYSGTMALDIDDWSRAAFELSMCGIDVQALYDAPDAVVIDSGRQGHGKLVYAMPSGVVLPSKKLSDVRATGEAYNYLDFRCGTSNGMTVQDVLPPSIHPDTKQPYRWAGKGHWTRLPQIPDALLAMWRRLIEGSEIRSIPTGTNFAVSWTEIHDALDVISPDCSRSDWIMVGMALHWAEQHSGETGRGQAMWDEWSQGSPKYPGVREICTQWRSFNAEKGNVVRLGSLIHRARQAGWKRRDIDASVLFSASQPAMIEMSDVYRGIRPTPPDINLDLFPQVLRDRAHQVSHEMGGDPLVPLFAGMAAIAGALDARSRLELLPRFRVAPVLWLMTIGNPALKKSPASKPMFSPLAAIEVEDRPRYQKEILDWEAKEARWSIAKKAFLDFAGSPEAMLDEPAPEVPDLPPKPVPLKFTVGDITSQKLVRVAADRPRGVLCLLDEMAGWVNKMTSRQGGDDRSAWVVGYEADRYEMDRVGAGTIHAENFAVSIYGNIQPDVFFLSMRELAADGLLQRFIPAVLRERDWGIGYPMPESLTNLAQWEQTVRLVSSLPAQVYKLSPEAHDVFREFQAWYNSTKQDEILLRSGSTFMTAFGKLEGTVGRLALVWHVIEAPFCNLVSADLLRRVIEFAKSYVVPAYRYAFGELAGGRATFDEWLSEFVVLRCDEPSISMSTIKASYKGWDGANPWVQDQWIIGAMVLLEEAGWVKRADDGAMEHRHQAVWAINPAMLQRFAAHRGKVVEAARRRALQSLASRITPERDIRTPLLAGMTPQQMNDLLNSKH